MSTHLPPGPLMTLPVTAGGVVVVVGAGVVVVGAGVVVVVVVLVGPPGKVSQLTLTKLAGCPDVNFRNTVCTPVVPVMLAGTVVHVCQPPVLATAKLPSDGL